MDEPEGAPWWRRPLIYSIAVVVLVSVGATVVFLVGSANRRSDRSALVAYERAIVPLVDEANGILEAEIPAVLEAVRKGQVSEDRLRQQTARWETEIERIRKELLALTPPSLLGDVEGGFDVMMGAYLLAVDAVESIAGAAPAQRSAAIDTADTFTQRAGDLFDDVAAIIQFHRRRLDLGTSPELPDATPTATT